MKGVFKMNMIKLIVVDCEEGLINNIDNHQENVYHKLNNIIEFINQNSNNIDVVYTVSSNESSLIDLFKNKIYKLELQPNSNNTYIHNNCSIFKSVNQSNRILYESIGRWYIYICGISYNSNIKDLIDDYLDIDGEISILKNCIIYYDKDDNRQLMREFDNIGIKILHTN